MPENAAELPPNAAAHLPTFGSNLLKFVQLIHQDAQYADDALNKSCIGLLGDLCAVPGMAGEMSSGENKAWIVAFLQANPAVEARVRAYAQSRLQAIGLS